MGHQTGKDLYRKLGRKIDNLTVRAPWNQTLYAILKELYSPQEADLILRMPYGLCTLEQISRVAGYKKRDLQKLLDKLCLKGLVIDIKTRGAFRYMIAPMVVGIFEYTMMRTDKNVEPKKMARLFHKYLMEDESFFSANFKKGNRMSFVRALPWRDSLLPDEYTEVLDYEKAEFIIDSAKKFAVSLCSCRHEKMHLGEQKCGTPMDNCSSFGLAADFLIRNNLAREVSRGHMLDNLARSREQKLALSADNIRKNVSFICHCCPCCCNLMLGIRQLGYANSVMTSSYLAGVNHDSCKGCGKCAGSCPIQAIKMVTPVRPVPGKKKSPDIDSSFCLGCGVCALACTAGALKLTRRKARVLHPANTFERVIMQSLERGTLQNFIFNNPQSMSHSFMRGFVGGFLRIPPVKRALVSGLLRSSFFEYLKKVI
ncbi:ATP-binding protein [Fibrobacterota bacterium]